jgi:transcriptional antiterminator
MQSGRLPIDFLNIRILALLDEQPFQSAYSIAEALCVSRLTILSHLRESLGMTILHLPWILRELTTNLRQIRMEFDESYYPFSRLTGKINFKDL